MKDDKASKCITLPPAANVRLGSEGDGFYPLTGPFFAMGSGNAAALAAMHMGADAQHAAEIAIKVDKSSGPPIHTLRLSDVRCCS